MCLESVGQANQQVTAFLHLECLVLSGVELDVPTCWLLFCCNLFCFQTATVLSAFTFKKKIKKNRDPQNSAAQIFIFNVCFCNLSHLLMFMHKGSDYVFCASQFVSFTHLKCSEKTITVVVSKKVWQCVRLSSPLSWKDEVLRVKEEVHCVRIY